MAPSPPTLAFLVDNLFDAFEEALWTSMVTAARDEGASLLCFLGGSLTPPGSRPRPGWGRNAVYDLVHPENVDGVIGLSNSVGCFLDDAELVRFYGRYAPLPILSLCRELAGMPSIVVDNQAGTRELLDHLIVHHGRRRIAFVRGPLTNTDAELRFQAYRESLDRHGIPFDPDLVCLGDFDRTSGIDAVGTLLDGRRARPDAVVAANDYMALYAMAELIRRGIDVPGEMVVAGFDDIVDAGNAVPSLTTVRQPLAEMGRAAVRRMLAMLRGDPAPPLEILPSRPVIRRSCGCHPALAGRRAPNIRLRRRGPETRLELAGILEQSAPELAGRLGVGGWAVELAGAFLRALDGPPDAFLEALERLVVRGLAHGVDPVRFHDVVHAALCAAGERTGADAKLLLVAESSARLVGDMAAHAQASVRIQAEEEARILRRMFLPVHLTEEGFRDVLLRELPTLGIRSFFLARFLDAEGRQAELRTSYDLEGRIQPPAKPAPFPSRRLLDGGFRLPGRHAHAVIPLHYIDERIGYALCEIGPMSPGVLEPLSTHTSTVLKVASLLQEVRCQASQLEAKVAERTRELREAQQQLLDTARQAGMAEMAVGVMHNVGNLLNSVSVCAEQIARRETSPHADGLRRAVELIASHRTDLADFFRLDARAALLPEYLGKVAQGVAQDCSLAREEAQQLLEKVGVVRDTIRGLQDLARDGRDRFLREDVDLRDLVDSVLETQAPLLIRHAVVLRKELGDPGPTLITDRPKLIHMLVNLVKNAVEAMRDTPGPRTLAVAAGLNGDRVRITVSDTGEGIPPENLDRVFSYGFTTKPDGHGFGLHTCALYAGHLGGSLAASSQGPGRGAVFTLELPREQDRGR